MLEDLRYSVRSLATHPAFVCAAAVVLGLAISINTALFTIVYNALFRPLPVRASDELVYLYQVSPRQPDRPHPTAVRGLYEHLRDHNEVFSALTGHTPATQMLVHGGETDIVHGEWVLGNYFDLLGVSPALGRLLGEADDDPALTERSVVISHRLWTRRFKADPDIVGKQVLIGPWSEEPVPYTVAGVTKDNFRGLTDPWTPSDFWITIEQSRHDRNFGVAYAIVARLKTGVSAQQAQAIVGEQGQQWLRTQPWYVANGRLQPRFIVLKANSVRMPFDPGAAVVPVRLAAALALVVASVLLISGVNIASLLLARGVGRAGEIAIRLVMGAAPVRVVRQLLIESVLLASVGGVLGFAGAIWLLSLFRAYTPTQYNVDVFVDGRIVIFVAGICLGVGVLVGIVPAIKAGRLDIRSALPGTGIGSGTRVAPRVRHWVVIPQLGLSLVLLLVAAVHVRALMHIELADLGYRTDGIFIVNFQWQMERAERKDLKGATERNAARSRLLYRLLVQRLPDVPGADGVALTTMLPLRSWPATSFAAVAQDNLLAGDAAAVGTHAAAVSPRYFDTMGMRFLRGRDFDERDAREAPPVAIVSASLAARLWPGRDPIGRFVASRNMFPAPGEKLEWRQVVGVVNDVDPVLRDFAHSPFIYTPLSQKWHVGAPIVVARVSGNPQTAIDGLKKAIAGSDATANVYRIQTVRQAVAEILYPRRMAAAILAASGCVGLFLAITGLYGVVSYSLAQRVHELGVRVALGANRAHLLAMLLREGLKLAAAGCALGALLAYPALRLAAKLFVAAPMVDVVAFATVPLVLTAIVLLACYVPGRRAASADPMAVLRRP